MTTVRSANAAMPLRWARHSSAALTVALFVLLMVGGARTPSAHADDFAYLIGVTVRPGYNFASAADALNYGHTVCDKVSSGRTYSEMIGEVKKDFDSTDEFQASYLVDKAVDELCPAQIWQLRNSAANYRPSAD
jgi:Protein of unknown function (DUF732)